MRPQLSLFRARISATAVALLLAGLAPSARLAPARHPQYGGTLRMEIGATINSLDPAAFPKNAGEAEAKREIESLLYAARYADGSVSGTSGSGAFRISEWQPGKHLTLAANEDAPGGRPFNDAIEIDMGRSSQDRLLDLALGRVDFAEIPAEDARQAVTRGVRISVSKPDELFALVLATGHAATEDARLREAVSQSIDRGAVVDFILQKQGEAAGGLLPQWSSGTAFLFPTTPDPLRAKELRSQIGASPQIRLGYDAGDALEQSIAERIAVNVRDAGISLSAVPLALGTAASTKEDARLLRLPMASPKPAMALANFLETLGPMCGLDDAPLPEAPSAEQIYQRESAIIQGFRIISLVWVPHVFGLSERVRDWQPSTAGEPWPLADVWLDTPAAANGQKEAP